MIIHFNLVGELSYGTLKMRQVVREQIWKVIKMVYQLNVNNGIPFTALFEYQSSYGKDKKANLSTLDYLALA